MKGSILDFSIQDNTGFITGMITTATVLAVQTGVDNALHHAVTGLILLLTQPAMQQIFIWLWETRFIWEKVLAIRLTNIPIWIRLKRITAVSTGS